MRSAGLAINYEEPSHTGQHTYIQGTINLRTRSERFLARSTAEMMGPSKIGFLRVEQFYYCETNSTY